MRTIVLIGASLVAMLIVGNAEAQGQQFPPAPLPIDPGILGGGIVTSTPEPEPRNWHLLQRQVNNGVAAVLHGLTKQECKFAKARIEGNPTNAEEKRRQDEEYKIRMGQTCPDNTKEAWEAWNKEHPLAQGCSHNGGMGMSVWGGGRTFSPTDIIFAECFQ